MSFMFKPLDYDDYSAINRPKIIKDYSSSIGYGNIEVARKIVNSIDSIVDKKHKALVLIDGYISANFDLCINLITQILAKGSYKYKLINMKNLYKHKEELEDMFKENLPNKSDEDPVCLFGKVFDGTFDDIFIKEKVKDTLNYINMNKDEVLILYGHGAASDTFKDVSDLIVYIDITPKTAAIRAREGNYSNIGDDYARPFSELMRRNYYIDFELEVKLRKQLLQEDKIDEYICGDHDNKLVLLEKDAFNEMLKELSKYPFRCKPVYLEGVWGGEYIRKVRNLDVKANNIAWIFDMIPMEVSVLVEYKDNIFEFPFATFFNKYPYDIMGEECTKRFGGYFPIRCNYDDTFHSNGNMSIQVHPNGEFVKANYNDKGSQDEAYYVIATGHDAKTYVGFKEDANIDEFFNKAHESEISGKAVDYKKYINNIPSTPGRQIMIPAGTIHSSGQNQFILELGSLTIGSYTFKIYDYNRLDSDGNKRPIHLINGKKVVDRNRRSNWVNNNIAIEPILTEEGTGYKEYLVGNTDLMYYQTKRVEIETGHKVSFKNNNQFTILTLVDGEKASIYSKENPDFKYNQKYLDIIIVPASIHEYVIENKGYQPIVVHKVMLK